MNKLNKSLVFSLIIILAVFGAIFITNFPFHSWFTGWDNLHPELNFPLNFARGFSAVWQDNQGLGTFGGHGYAATLPHTLMIFLMSFLIPAQFLRSIFTFLMLLTGTLGLFFLVRKILNDKAEYIGNGSALIASLYYMLNLGTVQQFFIQLEAFIIHFAALPWLFYILIKYFETKSKKILFIFMLVSLLASAQGFIPPLFIVYFMLLSIFLISYFVTKPSSQRMKSALLIFVLTILINAYWLLPVGYYSITHSGIYLNAYNNLASTGDFILKSQKYGNLNDVILLKGFIFEAIDGNQSGQTFLIFSNWISHLNKLSVTLIGYLFFIITLLGTVTLLKDKRKYINLAFGFSLILSFSLLATNTLPFSWVTDIFDKIPVLKQAFRVSFTKFSIATAFFYAIAIGMGISFLLSTIKRYAYFLLIPLIGLLIYFSLPVFQGNFLYSRAKTNIPDSYFKLFKFFQSQNQQARIADLPQGWNWGWSIYRWGYSGSGFLWYGIPQAILDRSFDVWGKYNENYYWELSYAIYSEKFSMIDQIMDKYQVNWILLDENVISYLNPQEFISMQKQEDYLDHSGKYKLVKTFKSGAPNVRDIKVYSVNLARPANKNGQAILNKNSFKNVDPNYNFTNYDQAYQEYGNYLSDPTGTVDVYYPFRTLFSNRKAEELNVDIQETSSAIGFKAFLPNALKDYQLRLPAFDPNYDLEKPNVTVSNATLTIDVPKNITTIYKSGDDKDFLHPKPSNCQDAYSSSNLTQAVLQKNTLRFTSKNAQNCHNIILNQFEDRFSYLISFDSRHIAGRQLEFSVINSGTRTSTLDVLLPGSGNFTKNNLILPPMQYYGLGDSLSFNNISIGNVPTVNDVKNLSVYRIPFYFLTNIELINPKQNYSTKNVFVFYQSYDPSWKAYELSNDNWFSKTLPFIFGRDIKNHLLVDNWANGWVIDQNSNKKIVVVFLPQYLEYLGFAILIVPVLISILRFLASKKHLKRASRVDF